MDGCSVGANVGCEDITNRTLSATPAMQFNKAHENALDSDLSADACPTSLSVLAFASALTCQNFAKLSAAVSIQAVAVQRGAFVTIRCSAELRRAGPQYPTTCFSASPGLHVAYALPSGQ